MRTVRDAKSSTPHAANGVVKALRQLFRFAVDYDYMTSNPATDVSYLATSSEGHHAWSEEEVAQFENFHPEGSPARLALALLLYTGQRRSDVVRMGPQHVKDGWLTITQRKNKRRNPVTVSLPVLPELQAAIDVTPVTDLTFLKTALGRPFTSNGFGNWFRKRCDETGLRHCSAHGLRKAGARRAAENGATEHQLMAIFGWKTLKEAERYTRAANQKTLAAAGIETLRRDHKPNKIVPLSNGKH
ncbi:MAG: hypothetical protein RLZ98_785 [Pseudomonadota bacterium]